MTLTWITPKRPHRFIAYEAATTHEGFTVEVHHNGCVCLVGPGGGNIWQAKFTTIEAAKAFAEQRMS